MSIASLRQASRLFLGLLLACALSAPAWSNEIHKGGKKGFDRFIVQFKPGAAARGNAQARQRALDRPGRALGLSINHERRLGVGADLVRTSRKLGYRQAEDLMNRLREDPDVAFVEVDRIMRPSFVPNDPLYASHQWHYSEAIGGIAMPAAWDMSTGSGVVVAVLDTGILRHNDLTGAIVSGYIGGNVVAGYDFITDLDHAADGNGRDADPSDPGDFAAAGDCGAGEPEDPSSWHGTHVAGTVAALTNNGSGVAGVAYNAKVMPLRVLGHCGGYSSDIADAIVWAAGGAVTGVPANSNPVEVINMSLGGEGSCGTATQNAINYAVNQGVVVVVAAGNDNANAMGHEPANCANVITVGASTRTGGRASYSNYGSAIDVSAPGGETGNAIASTWNAGTTTPGAQGYGLSSGTSMAAPHVAGTVALMQALAPSTPATVENVLKSTASTRPVTPCLEGCGTGIIHAAAAVGSVGNGALMISDARTSEGDAGTKTLTFTVSLSKALASPVTFSIATANGSASAGSDYVALSLAGQSLPAGTMSKNFAVTINGDTTVEANETFTVNLSAVTGVAVVKAQGLGTIDNDDATGLSSGVVVSPISGATGTGLLYSLVVPAGKTSLIFSTSGGTGDADLYVRRGALPTTTVADKASQGGDNNETVSFANPVAGTYYVLVYSYSSIAGVSLVGTYTPNEQPTISIGDAVVTEGNSGTTLATFTVSLSQTSTSPVGFDLVTENGTAFAGSDYDAVNLVGQSIPAGQSSTTVSVGVKGDTVVEGNETFTANLRNVTGALLAGGQGRGRINNDDLALLSIDNISIAEGDSGISTATFVVRLNRPQPHPVTYSIATSNGSASAGSDYVARSLTGRFLDAGRTTQTFEVQINGDGTAEADETINVNITGVTGATVADNHATATLVNDDAAARASTSGVVTVMSVESQDDERVRPECRSAEAMAQARRVGKSVRHCLRESKRR